ncbi:hypothetical protein [Streptomyces griseosporeus]|uniref:hypothetical protein n=1 Tax=Streptomyces griseosporeus TaxID=1910 RepID=UPI0037BB7C4A
MSVAVRRTAYGLGAAASVFLAATVLSPSPADAAAPTSITSTVKSKYFTGGYTTITCPSGYVATGGGVGADSTQMYVVLTEPTRNSAGRPNGWKGWVQRTNGAYGSGTIYVVCTR